MNLVRVKEKYQVTLPTSIRQKLGVSIGDLVEFKSQGKRVTVVPNATADRGLLDKGLAAGLRDARLGRGIGPFKTAEEAIRALRAETRKRRQ